MRITVLPQSAGLVLEAPSARFRPARAYVHGGLRGCLHLQMCGNMPLELQTLTHMWRHALQVKAAVQEAPHPSAAKPQGNGRFTVVAQPIIVPRMIRPG